MRLTGAVNPIGSNILWAIASNIRFVSCLISVSWLTSLARG